MLTSKYSKRLVSLLLSLAAVLLVLSSCAKNGEGGEYAEYNYFIMDTYVTIKLAREKDGAALGKDYLDAAAAQCSKILVDIDSAISSHNENSDVYRLNSDYDYILAADDKMLSMLDIAETVAELTNGAYDYTLGCLTEL